MEQIRFILIILLSIFTQAYSKSPSVAYVSNVEKHSESRNVNNQTESITFERCRLCTPQLAEKHDWDKKGLVKKTIHCYHKGDFHDFYHQAWVISIIPPNISLSECYIDLFAPKDDIFSNENLKKIDRIFISSNCHERCRSTNNRFAKISPQPWNKNSYLLKIANESGNNGILVNLLLTIVNQRYNINSMNLTF